MPLSNLTTKNMWWPWLLKIFVPLNDYDPTMTLHLKMPIEMIQIAINTLQSNSITPEEAAIGHFTLRKLRKLSTWTEWKKGEHK